MVIGGGVLGAAVARVAARTRSVIVASRTQRQHAGLWVRFELGRDPVRSEWARAARLILCVGASDVAALTGLLPPGARVVVVGPLGVAGTPSVVCGPAWDLHERSIQPVLDAMRRGQAGHIPRDLPERRWIWAEDVARVALDPDLGPVTRVRGPALLDRSAFANALAQRERGACTPSWRRGGPVPPDPPGDDWDDARWGVRRRFGIGGA